METDTGVEMDTGVERTHVAVARLRLVECGTNGAGSPTTSHWWLFVIFN